MNLFFFRLLLLLSLYSVSSEHLCSNSWGALLTFHRCSSVPSHELPTLTEHLRTASFWSPVNTFPFFVCVCVIQLFTYILILI